jgi:teichuronic acid biosynthesis glycosyltransferase TuaC
MKVLYVSSANQNSISPIIKNQGESLHKFGIDIDYYGIKGKGIVGYLSNIPKVRLYILKTEPDIIHAHYSLSSMVTGLTFSRKPLIVSLMGSDAKSGAFIRWCINWFSRLFWDAVIIKSESMISSLSIKEPIVIPNGVNLSLFKPLDNYGLKDRYSFSQNKKTILFLANPSRLEKNYKLAEQAFNLLDPSTTELQVRYSLPQEEIPLLINAADVVLLTSKWEGSPNLIKEAMACNCPIVATDVGDIRWLFGNVDGHYITSFNPNDVAEKLKYALIFVNEKSRTNGRERIIELGLDSESIAERIFKLYEKILD